MDSVEEALIHFLQEYVTEERQALISKVLSLRTRFITVVLEDIYQPQNASAVIRTCDCFGIQDLHIIENQNEYQVNPRVVHGASKWVSLHRYNEEENNTAACLNALKKQGYTLLGTVPDPSAKSIHDVTFDKPTALIFGTEISGLSDDAKQTCDELVTYPMSGFTESLNISVSASLCLGAAVQAMKKAGVNWHLSEEEKKLLTLEWYKYSVSRSDVLEREFRKKMK